MTMRTAISPYDVVVLGDREFCSTKLGRWLAERKVYFCLRHKCDTQILSENEVYQELRDYGLKPGMKLFINDCQVTKNPGFGTFNVACKWKKTYRGFKTKEPWYILTNFSDLDTAILSYQKRFSIEEAMQRGLGEAARSWGSPPETKPDYVEPLWLVGYAEKG